MGTILDIVFRAQICKVVLWCVFNFFEYAAGVNAVCRVVPDLWTSWCKWLSLCPFHLTVASKWSAEGGWHDRAVFPRPHSEFSISRMVCYRMIRGVTKHVFFLLICRSFLLHIVCLLRRWIQAHCKHHNKRRVSPSLPLISMLNLSSQFWR